MGLRTRFRVSGGYPRVPRREPRHAADIFCGVPPRMHYAYAPDGAALAFEPRGTRALRGVPGEWALWAVR